MADNSLDSLLEWMKTENPLRGWGMLLAVERKLANTLLMQEYISRFGATSYLPPITDYVPGFGDDLKEKVVAFVMDAPRLSFENARLNNSKAKLTMAVVGGSHVTLELGSNGWNVKRMAAYDPLQGPELHLDLLLNDAPGNVEADGRILLDLSISDNFRLTFASSQAAQELGGQFFKVLFNRLESAQRVYPLGRLLANEGKPIRPESFKLVTQAKWSLANREPDIDIQDGAILALIKLEDGGSGDTPGVDNYRYLIPDSEAAQYSATVLFDKVKVAPVLSGSEQLLEALITLLGGDSTNFEVQREGGMLVKATAKKGSMAVPAKETQLMPFAIGTEWVTATAHTDAISIPAVGPTPLTLMSEGEGKYSIRWVSIEQTNIHLITFDKMFDDRRTESPCLVDLEAIYELVEEEDGSIVFKATTFTVKGSPPPATPLREQEAQAGLPEFLVYLFLSLIIFGTSQITSIISSAIRFTLDIDVQVNQLMAQLLEINFDNLFTPDLVKFPDDLACFGRIAPSQTAFIITPLEPLILAGRPQPFRASPDIIGLTWTVTTVDPDGGPAGEINSRTGEYTAPDAAAMSGIYSRIRVTATSSQASSSALATVVVNSLTINPLFTRCLYNNPPLTLAAGQLEAGLLEWSIKTPVPGESGAVEGNEDGTGTYTPPSQTDLKDYTVDEVVVKNTATGATRSMVMLVEHNAPMFQVSADAPAASGESVQLHATRRNSPVRVTWTIELGGPGRIDQALGLYEADIAAPESFVVVKAHSDTLDSQEYAVLPLPLTAFPEEIALLGRDAKVQP